MAELLEPGRVLAGRYRLESEIARGGMGTVWRAEDPLLAREVALKTLDPVLGRDEQTRARFRREAIAAAAVAHPNIVATYDTGQDADDAFIVMELVEGRTLRQVIDAMGPLPIARAADIAYQVADALSVAHARGLIHRDIKPGNVLVQADGRVKVTDFGIAKATDGADDELTRHGTVVGTARYLAPEQVDGGNVDARTDIYSLGLVLSEMLTGSPPFPGDSDIGTAVARLTSPPRPIALDRPDVPSGLEHIASRALCRAPDERWQNAAAMRDALASFRTGAARIAEPTAPVALTPRSVPATTQVVTTRRRSRAGRVFLWLAAFVVGVTAGYAIYHAAKTDDSGPKASATAVSTTLRPVAVTDYDPRANGGDGSEDPAGARNVIDGNPATTWQTESYFQRDFGGRKPGVGLIIDLGAPRSVRQVQIDTADTGWGAAIYGITGVVPPDLAGWGRVLARGDNLPQNARMPVTPTTARYVLAWFDQLPATGPPYRLSVAEIRVLGT
ncbi:MAG TPA: protein kinase [Acidimicrobiia bacterium]